MITGYLSRVAAYWKSRQSSLHGLILFLGGSAGITALHLVHMPDRYAQAVSGACMILGALLVTPEAK